MSALTQIKLIRMPIFVSADNVILDSATNITLDDGSISSARLIHLIAATGVVQNATNHDGLQATDLLLEGGGAFTLVNDSATNLITNVATVGTVAGVVTFENNQALVIGTVADDAAVNSNGAFAQTLLVSNTVGDFNGKPSGRCNDR